MEHVVETGQNPAPLMRAGEVADLLQVTVQRLAVMRLEGSGPRYLKLSKFGAKFGAVRYARADVLDWIEKRRRRSTSESASGAQLAA